MKNFIQPGKQLTLTAAADVTSGDVVVVGDLFGVAATTAKTGEEYELSTGGIYELPKTTAEAWTVGQAIYVTPAGVTTTTVGANTKIGVAVLAADAAAALGTVRLNDNF